jgi:hypothetical protein
MARHWRASSCVRQAKGLSLPTRRSRVQGGLPIDDPRWREPAADMAQNADGENGPAARSFAADAHDCIMVRIQRTYRIQILCSRATNSGKSISPTTEPKERAMQYATTLPVPQRTCIREASQGLGGHAGAASGRRNHRQAHPTLRWRETDSNFQFLAARPSNPSWETGLPSRKRGRICSGTEG